MKKTATIDSPSNNNVQDTNWIKAYIVDVLPCLTTLLYVLAVIYNVAFFSAFNIDVTDFISFGDILVSIIQPLLLLTLFLLLMVALVIYFVPSLVYHKEKQHVKAKEKVRFIKSFVGFLHASVFYRSFKLFTFSFLVIAPTYYFLFTRSLINNFEGRYSGFVPIFIPVLLTIILFACKALFDSELTIFQQFKIITIPDKILTFILYFIFAVAVVYESGYRDGKSILQRDEVAFELTLTDNNSYDNNRFTYIKHSGGRIFLYDKLSKSSLVVFDENVLSLNINSRSVQKKSVIDYILDNSVTLK